MNKVAGIRTAIKSALVAVHPRVYFERAPKDAIAPYVVFDLPNSIDDGSMERFVLDVDGWDTPDNGDTTALETLMDNVDVALHRRTLLTGVLSLTFYRENRLTLTDDDALIRRRKYIYQIRTHMGG